MGGIIVKNALYHRFLRKGADNMTIGESRAKFLRIHIILRREAL
jgi:hypothetical protein